MSTIITRAGKGAPLTYVEADANFTNLNTDKLEKNGGTLTNGTLTNGTLTNSTLSGRISGDFSNATHSNRVLFQTNIANGHTNLGLVPKGTGTTSRALLYSNSDVDNSHYLLLQSDSTRGVIGTSGNGTAEIGLPLQFYTSSQNQMTISADGGVGFGETSPAGDSDNRTIEMLGTVSSRIIMSTDSGSITNVLDDQNYYLSQLYLPNKPYIIGAMSSGSNIELQTGGTTRLNILNDGNVYIPGGSLRIGYSPNLITEQVEIYDGNLLLSDYYALKWDDNTFISGTAESSDLWLATNALTRLYINSSGNIGIGNSNPDTSRVLITHNNVGTLAGDQSMGLRLTSGSANTDFLEISNFRSSAGSSWTSAGYRLQQKVDSTWMGWMQFNNGDGSSTNNNGISWGTGSSTVSALAVPQVMKLDSTGLLSITKFYSPGTVVQTVTTRSDTKVSYAANAATNTEIAILSTSFTPKFSNSKIILQWNLFNEVAHDTIFRVGRSGTIIGNNTTDAGRWSGSFTSGYDNDQSSTPRTSHFMYVDTPNTTSAVTYQLYVSSSGATNVVCWINRPIGNAGADNNEVGISQLVIQEIAV